MKKKNKNRRSSRSARQRRQVRRRRLAAWTYRLLLMVLILVAGSLALTIFFRLDHVEIEGETRYAQAAIENTLGLEKGDNLFFFRKLAAEKRLEETYPYIDEVVITRRLPDTLVLHITEAEAAVAIPDGSGGYYLASRKGKLLEHTDEAGAAGVPAVTGVQLAEGTPGQYVPMGADEEQPCRELFYLVERLYAWGLLQKTDFINVSALYDVRVGYDGRLDIRLGTIETAEDQQRTEGTMALLDKKLRFAIYIFEEKLSPSDIVVIDLTDVSRASTRVATAEEVAASALPITEMLVSDEIVADSTGGTE